MTPKVSILVPIYNVEKYLVQCLDSIVNQTLKDIEIICVNDGSTDSSLQILKSYAENDDRFVIVDKENGGYGMAMNIASDRATGEYIGIVEPDDYILPEMFEKLYNKAKEFDLDFVKSDFCRFKENKETGKQDFELDRLSENEYDYNVVFAPCEKPEALNFTMNTWCGIYKKSFIVENNIRYNETPGASFQDTGFWYQTFVLGKRAMLTDTPYYMHRIDNPNSSTNDKKKIYSINIEYEFIREFFMRHPEKWELFREMFWYQKFFSFMVTLSKISNEHKKEYIRYISEDLKTHYRMGEFNNSLFDKLSWFNIRLLMASPDSYYHLHEFMRKDFVKKFKSSTHGKKK